MDQYPKEVDVPVPWGVVKGQWWGPESKEPIVFMHGWQDNLGSFERLLPLLPPGLPYFLFDMPGHGLSSRYPKGMIYNVYWDGLILLRRMVKYFKWRRISVIGHSLGGGIGFLYAANFPQDIAKLVSLDIVCPQIRSPSFRATLTKQIVEQYISCDEQVDEEAGQPCYGLNDMMEIALHGYQNYVNRANVEILMKRGMKKSERNPAKYLFTRDPRQKSALLGLPSQDLMMEMASNITCQYFNIKTSNEVYPDRHEIYKEVLDVIKKSASVFIFHDLQGTHHIHMSDPEKIAPLISKFLTDK